MRRRGRIGAALLLAATLAAGLPAGGQQLPAAPNSALLTLDQDALYLGSAWGRRAQAQLEARSREVAAENDRIAAQLEGEDDALTNLRASLPDDEFRRRAEAFDKRVQQVRAERDRAGRALLTEAERDRTAFLQAALPVFTAMMRERGASAILDRRTVFLAIDSIDVTDAMIARIDAEVGDGAQINVSSDPGTAPEAGTPGNAPATGNPAQPAGSAPQPLPAAPATGAGAPPAPTGAANPAPPTPPASGAVQPPAVPPHSGRID